MRLILPYPPSLNKMWRSYVPKGWTRAIVVLTAEAKAYKHHIRVVAREHGMKPIRGRVEIQFKLVPKNGICMDLSNSWKVAEDALQGICYDDDAHVYRIVAERGEPDELGERLEVEVTGYEPPPSPLFAQTA
jgi:crossover junction endodeoxyribonuclease RusA